MFDVGAVGFKGLSVAMVNARSKGQSGGLLGRSRMDKGASVEEATM